MRPFSLFTLLSSLFIAVSPAMAGYTVHIRPQVTPKYITVQRAGNWQTVLNPGGHRTDLPIGFTRQLCPARDIHSTAYADRAEVWEEFGGTATDAEVFTFCPDLRESKRAEIRDEGDRRLKALATPYMDGERETWPVQMKEAEAYLFDPMGTQTPMLSAMAAARGISVGELVGKVWGNVILFRQASGAILGTQQRLLDLVDAAATVDGLLAIGWPQ